jgi:hypothetical protein
MTDRDTRRGAVELGTVLMIAAFAIFGGFLYWLTGQAEAERALDLVEDTASAIVDEYADAIPIGAADIMLDASPYEGQLVRLEPQVVASAVGQQGYMIELPTGPFLVSLSDELRAANLEIVTQQSVVRVTGTVTAMTPEIAAGWQEAGRLSEGERMVAEFAVYFIAAEEIEVSTPSADGA